MKLSAVLSVADVKIALENYLRTKDVDIEGKHLTVIALDAEGNEVGLSEIALEISEATQATPVVEKKTRKRRSPNKAKESTEPVVEEKVDETKAEDSAEDGEEISLDSTPTPSIFGSTDGVEKQDNSTMLTEETKVEEVAAAPTPSIFS